MKENLYNILFDRGFIHQATESASFFRQMFEYPRSGGITGYIGFDPTADSLHVGSLVPLRCLHLMARCGFSPIALIGGATGMIGDPSGKTEMRKVLSQQQLDDNISALTKQISHIVPNCRLRNNHQWIGKMSWLDVLTKYGKHFSINHMLSMDSVKSRLDKEGLSFLEFNYMILQAIDFLHLYETEGCTLQMGGQDQYGNIVMGLELIRKIGNTEGISGKPAGITTPLITKSDGTKFGKSESGTIWLDEKKTSVFDFFQFWRNTPDKDVEQYLKLFTTCDIEAIPEILEDINAAKEVLALDVTSFVHGHANAHNVWEASKHAFAKTDQNVMNNSIPHSTISKVYINWGRVSIVDLLRKAGFAKSNGEARRLVEGNGVKTNGHLVSNPGYVVGAFGYENNRIVLTVGKKKIHRFDVEI
jgi:tyrosyl-tRNA synthetase